MIQEVKQKANEERKGKLIKDSLYPFIVKHSKSVEDARMFLSVLAVVINQKFLNGMMTTKLSDLKLEDELIKGTEQEKKYKEFFEIFGEQDLRTVLDILDALPKGIERAIRKENENKLLSDIKIPFINEKTSKESNS
jgi:hypothetical protein